MPQRGEVRRSAVGRGERRGRAGLPGVGSPGITELLSLLGWEKEDHGDQNRNLLRVPQQILGALGPLLEVWGNNS